MSMWWSLQLRREAASVPLARRLLLGAMETAGVDPEISYDLSLALTEACANAVEHGTGESGADRSGADGPGVEPCGGEPGRTGERPDDAYRVTAYLDGDRCRIEVADTGPGFGRRGKSGKPGPPDRAAVDAEDGRGLFLIESLADHVRFRDHADCGGGAVVSFDKTLKWRGGRGVEDAGALLKAS
ncbi:ATP-binding protein [Streptomyces sp. NPDC054796]